MLVSHRPVSTSANIAPLLRFPNYSREFSAVKKHFRSIPKMFKSEFRWKFRQQLVTRNQTSYDYDINPHSR